MDALGPPQTLDSRQPPLAVTGLWALPLAPTLAGVLVALLVTNVGRALYAPPMAAWLGDLFPAAQRSQANAAVSLVAGVMAISVLVTSGALFERVGRAAPSCSWPSGPGS